MTLIKSLGFLRLSLLAFAILNIALRPAPGAAIVHTGPELITTLIAPAAAPIILLVIMFDALMSKVRASDAEGEEETKFTRIMFIELAMAIILVIAWFPYFIALGK